MSQLWVNFAFALGEIRIDLHPCCISCPAEVPVAKFREEENCTEAETKMQKRSKTARITRRLVPLAARVRQPQLTFRAESAGERYWSRLSTMVCIF